jgi:Flp pilus assembly protein TadG
VIQDFSSSLLQVSGRFAKDIKGTVAVLFGICAIPILMAASVALDMSSASQMKSEMQAAADSAVLAAATRLAVNASDGDKEQLALDTFYANLSPILAEHAGTPSVEIDFPAKQVHLAVSLEKQAVLTTLVSDGSIISVEATATIAPGTPICMMALNPHVEKALTIQGTADLMATDCAVHVNSDDTDNALHQHGSATATADSFCVHGGYSGDNFTPSPEKCGYETDPLLAGFLADWATEEISSWPCKETNFPQINTGAATITELAPGVYCGGLTIKQGTVQLKPGEIYVFRDGPLQVQAQATLQGVGTPILLEGDDSTRLITQAGASIMITARTEGQFKGLVIAQHPSSVPDKENLIIGGGEMDLNGVLYFPTQPLKITGNGDIGSGASQFAILADTIAIEGNGQLNIKIGQNYPSSGLPALPEANEVVHLIK